MLSDKGNCYASYLLRILYESVQGVEKNSTQMVKYLEPALLFIEFEDKRCNFNQVVNYA